MYMSKRRVSDIEISKTKFVEVRFPSRPRSGDCTARDWCRPDGRLPRDPCGWRRINNGRDAIYRRAETTRDSGKINNAIGIDRRDRSPAPGYDIVIYYSCRYCRRRFIFLRRGHPRRSFVTVFFFSSFGRPAGGIHGVFIPIFFLFASRTLRNIIPRRRHFPTADKPNVLPWVYAIARINNIVRLRGRVIFASPKHVS